MPFSIFLIAPILASLGLIWLAYGVPGAIELTGSFASFCQSLFFRCVEYSSIAKLIFLWSGAAIVSIGLIYASLKGAWNIYRARRAVMSLPLLDMGTGVVLIRDLNSRAAFTEGLLNPRIYISTGLLSSLERKEVLGVFLHELKHKRGYDPLRFFLLSFLKDAFFYIPLIAHLASKARIKKEHEADDSAARALGEVSIAGALVKVASFNRSLSFQQASITGSDVPTRVTRLLDGKEAVFSVPLRAVVASLIAAILITFSLSMPLYATQEAGACTEEHCSMHINKLEGCRTHCGMDSQRQAHHH